MPLPRVRFTVRRMMRLVVVVALAIGGILWAQRMSRLSKELLEIARDHEQKEHSSRGDARIARNLASVPDVGRPAPRQTPDPFYEDRAIRSERSAERHRMLKEKYTRAARWPFLPVAPDPPEPE